MDFPAKIRINNGMDFFVKKPAPSLDSYIDLFWASNGNPDFREERIIPDGSCLLLFNFGKPVSSNSGNFHLPVKRCIFTGVFTNFISMKYDSFEDIHQQVGVIFKPGGAYPFIRMPIEEFKNQAIDAELINKSVFEKIYDQLGEADSCESRIMMLEKIFLEMQSKFDFHTLPQDFINLIKFRNNLKVNELVDKTGYSQQYVNKILRAHAGVNLKSLQTIFKVSRAIKMLQGDSKIENFAALAHDLDYFDQPHFIHQIKKMTGFTPKEFKDLSLPITSRVIYL
ncbi:MAG: helix-turn-helix transcriptional regulator [Cytophagaceae bacterium]|nr:helix-turn-helix transcriptional regulator [Cytophagaceae bacterium]